MDGSVHCEEEQREYDCIRDEYLRERGLRVIRITNQEVRDDFENVVERIESILKDLTP
jgi:very-short-patch-repair endonuclease